MFYRRLIACAFAFMLGMAVLLGAIAGPVSVRARQNSYAPPQQQQENTASRPRRTGDAPAAQPAATPPQKPAPAKGDEKAIDEDEVLRVETDLTNTLFTAVDRNKRFITTLKQEDVRVFEDNVEQQVFTFQRETARPLSLAIVIDTSASEERIMPELKNAARGFVDAVIRPNKDEVAVLSFTGETTLEQGLTGNTTRVRRAIDRVEFVPPSGYVGGGVVVPGTPPISDTNQRLAGSTAIWDAVWVTSKDVLSESSDKTRRAIILLTDGVDTSSQTHMSDAVDRAIKTDAIIYAIGIGDNFFDGVDRGSLNKVAERTGGRAYFPRNEEDLRGAFAQIQEELRSQYLLAYSPTNKAKDGSYRQVRIEVVNPELRKQNLRLTYRQGYFAQATTATNPSKSRRP
ncbi:MAG: VWA domain-containing protein [Acidobacteria bacterium]|nr:VWA domain-containing protein [Acidobacteriota bacterium]